MIGRIIERAEYLVAELSIKIRRLERERVEHGGMAAERDGPLLGERQQPAPEPLRRNSACIQSSSTNSQPA